MNLFKSIFYFLLPIAWLRKKWNIWFDTFLIFSSPRRHRRALKKLSTKNRIKIAFFAINSSAWKFETLYRLFEQNERFEPVVILCPLIYYGDDHGLELMDKTYHYFINNDYNVIKSHNDITGEWMDVKKVIDPDIIFFTHPWGLTKPKYQIRSYPYHLTCYSPYSFNLSELHRKSYADFFNSVLWKNFLETEFHSEFYKKTAKNPGNAVVTGYPGTDILIDKNYTPDYKWKISDPTIKRIIWAPHHTIPGQGVSIDFSSFCTYADFMKETAEKYKDKIQIAFKPHPMLRNKLYRDAGWGEEKTDAYFTSWERMYNGQLCESDYMDLFLTSDAMILDSISFIAEYLYTKKPSLFIMNDNEIDVRLNEFGQMAIQQHYHAFNEKEIIQFIESVVIAGNDTKKEERLEFVSRYLLPPGSLTATENIFNHICKCIGI